MLYLFYGPDSHSAVAATTRVKDQFLRMHLGAEVCVIDFSGDASDQGARQKLLAAFASQGLFGTHKFILLRSFLSSANRYPQTEGYLLSALERFPDDIVVVMLEGEKFDKRNRAYKAIQKMAAESREFLIPEAAGLRQWVRSYLAEYNWHIEPAALELLVERLGEQYSLWQCSMELTKLMLFHPEHRQITAADIEAVVPQSIPANVFTLTNLVAEGQTPRALAVLEQMVAGISGAETKQQLIQIVGALAAQIRSLLVMKAYEHLPPAQVVKALGWKEGRVWVNKKLARKFTNQKLQSLLVDLRAMDLKLKTTEEPAKLLLTLFLQRAKV